MGMQYANKSYVDLNQQDCRRLQLTTLKNENPPDNCREDCTDFKNGTYWCYEILLILQPTDFDCLTDTSFPATASLIASFK